MIHSGLIGGNQKLGGQGAVHELLNNPRLTVVFRWLFTGL
jgi:hypothetical protein